MCTELESGSVVSSLRLAAVLTAVSCARGFTRHTLAAWRRGEAVDTAVLIASELVTNAVQATGNTDQRPNYLALRDVPLLRVRLSLRSEVLVIAVWDTSPKLPVREQQSEENTRGRGLFIVEALCERWGAYASKVGGKVVWAQIAAAENTQSVPRDHMSPRKPNLVAVVSGGPLPPVSE
jgi:anti-sigma regulatory factor (Ser/Thr protein kinase)